jgi:NADH dehydrogenase (ubiquinone) 1 alpha/beta subcomplex 1
MLTRYSRLFFSVNKQTLRPSTQYIKRFYANEEKPAATGSFLPREEVTSRVIEVIKKHEKVQPDKVSERSHLEKDLGLDSLDAAEIVNEIEQEFSIEIPDEEAFKLSSVPDIVNYVASSPLAK